MKTEFKGTKGNWTSRKPEGSNGFCYVDSELTTMGGLATCYNGSFEHREESAYNATLISCAPEMLEMLQEILHFKRLVNVDKIQQLITKATTI